MSCPGKANHELPPWEEFASFVINYLGGERIDGPGGEDTFACNVFLCRPEAVLFLSNYQLFVRVACFKTTRLYPARFVVKTEEVECLL